MTIKELINRLSKLEEEKYDLFEKIVKLDKFLKSYRSINITKKERDLLIKQYKIMNDYYSILEQRSEGIIENKAEQLKE